MPLDASPRRVLAAAVTAVLAVTLSAAPAPAAPAADPGSGPFAVVDPQTWENPDTMTWADFRKPPGTD